VSKPGPAISVTILGKEYRVGCDAETEDQLINAARFLDGRMREVRGSGKVIGTDRIAVMVALNLAHELLHEKSEQDSAAGSANKRIRSLRERIEMTLTDGTQLEL